MNANHIGYWVYTCAPNEWAMKSRGEWLLMAATLRDLVRWSVKPAKNVDTATTPRVNVLRGLAARATTPLLPDDYLKLLNPLWSARELRGEIVEVRERNRGLGHRDDQAWLGLLR